MTAQAVRERAGPSLIILICFLIAAVEGFDIQAFGVAAPKLAPDLGLDPSQQGWAASAAMIGLVIGAVLGGWFADRVGRKPVLLISVAMFGLFSIVTAVSQGYDALLWARFLTGLGFGGAMPNLIAIAAEISAPKRRAATVTMMFCGMPAGGAAVSLLARLMGDDLAWRSIFMIGGVVPLILLPLVFFLLPETRPEHKEGADRSTWRGLFGQGRAAPTVLLWVVFVMTLVVLYLMLNWLPTLVVAKGLTPAAGSSAALAFNLTSIAGALLLGFVVDRAGYRWPVTFTFLLLALAMGALAAAGQLAAVLALSGVAGFLLLGAQYSLYAVIPSLYPPQVRAAGSGAAVAVGRLGSIAGPLVAGELRGAGYSAGQVFGVMIPVVLAAAAAVFALSWLAKPHGD
ncbi:3-(3-hydroxy-phenyl)propionate transporter MhpT [Phenylobacterium sp.]|uniref:3-(3-hydroxy-phenyl)propionate transporter MhpT n=1 Tax=Phenylobacterium sp. TaxID=1871053 RepID=UPI002E342385|nr:3-(3-hydroxy-phenyl)propionate transporter MhpT [Phenylobacterium sp.]HEX2559643.1 3-(3-hydroxy-phenyl)propionate transporter MhpT [Phenylobacterium sp.]